MANPSIIQCRDLSFTYAGATSPALRNVNLSVAAGEFIVITGKSGCGKSTFARCLNGLIPHFFPGEMSGTVTVQGAQTDSLSIGEIGSQLGTVFQDPRSQFFMIDTTSEMAFGCANHCVGREEIIERIDRACRDLGTERLKDRSVFTLSSGELQQVAITSCYAMRPSIYLFDEPSANLDLEAIERLREALRRLKAAGHTVFVLEHRLFYLIDLFDRMLVFDNGRLDRTITPDEALTLTPEQVAEQGLRQFSLPAADIVRTATPIDNAPVFEVEDLEFRSFKFGNVTARGGEVVGVIGSNGVGKTTFARLCCGLERQSGGVVKLDGKALSPRERLAVTRLVMQDSDYQLFAETVRGELAMSGEDSTLLRDLNLEHLSEHHPAALSRGQKQRLTIACALAEDKPVYFFDEPTSGLDRENMWAVSARITQLAERGKLVFVITHDAEFLAATCTRTLRGGRA